MIMARIPLAPMATACIIGAISSWCKTVSVRRLTISFVILSSLIFGGDIVHAKKNKQATPNQSTTTPDSSNLNTAGAFQAIDPEDLDPTTAYLLWQLTHKPELMNVEYLTYYLGAPDSTTHQIGIRSHAYYWYDSARQPKCELYQEHDKPGEVVESQMMFHLPQRDDFNFKALEDPLGPPVRRFFDHDGHATQMFQFVPNTTLSLASPMHTHSIRKATVTYMGPPLGNPSNEDMQIAHDTYVAKSRIAVNSGKVNWQSALLVARDRVRMHPMDVEAHLALAQALKKTGNIHEAIGEYKFAMSLSQYNQTAMQECVAGLKELRVLPANYGQNVQGSTGIAGTQRKPIAGTPTTTH